MIIKRSKSEILIRVSRKTIGNQEVQHILNFIRYKELTSTFKVKRSTVEPLVNSINERWWNKNKKRIFGEIVTQY